MNKDEMIEEIAKVVCKVPVACKECVYDHSYCIIKQEAMALYNANCRIIAEDEIVIKKSKYEELLKSILLIDIEQETAKTILNGIYNRLRYATFQQTTALRIVEDFANELGIELR